MIDKNRKRYAGILLHPTSLPGNSGIGDIGYPAREFIKLLVKSGQSLWQILPLGPSGYGNSPYAAYSAFAGNPMLVSLELLHEDGLLESEELQSFPELPAGHVDYESVNREKGKLLCIACARFVKKADASLKAEYKSFCKKHRKWLDDFSLFMALKDAHNELPWNKWEKPLVRRNKDALTNAKKRLAPEIKKHKLIQFFFFRQWLELKNLANENGIAIIGDIPIFVAYNSADVWSNPGLFYLDSKGAPTVGAGVPPDYFSKTGQLWGNPLYRWKAMKADNYRWWVNRMKMILSLVDIVRLDHFRGFEAYWEVPAGEKTAVNGRWVKGPGADFFKVLKRKLGDLPLIAEDLGVITPKVEKLRDNFNLPGMKVLHFAFGSGPHNPYLPHNHIENSVIYPGTHDNDTTVGWYENADEDAQDHVRNYFSCNDNKASHYIMRAVWSSCAKYAVIQLQDILGLGTDCRMNIPGTGEGNWQWRFSEGDIKPEHIEMLLENTEFFGRGEPEIIEYNWDEKNPNPDEAIERDD